MIDDFTLPVRREMDLEIESVKAEFDAKIVGSGFVEKMDLIKVLSKKLYKIAKKNDILEIKISNLEQLIEMISISDDQKSAHFTPKNSLDEVIARSMFFSVVNFCFVDPLTKSNYTKKSPHGQAKLSLALRDVFDDPNHDWCDFEKVSKLNLLTWKKMIQIGPNNPLYLWDKRWENLMSLAKYLKKDFQSIAQMCQNFTDASILFDYLDKSGLFEDRFKKRLQLLLREWDQHLKMFRQKGLKNISALTGMADYRIPQFLITEKILKVNNSDLARLQGQTTFREDDHFVLFMRAATILIISEIALAMDESESTIDAIIWKIAHEKNINTGGIIPAMLVATDQF